MSAQNNRMAIPFGSRGGPLSVYRRQRRDARGGSQVGAAASRGHSHGQPAANAFWKHRKSKKSRDPLVSQSA
jgi:hypothetical protein